MSNDPITTPRVSEPPYDPPRVEHVLGPDELEREVHYAGVISGSG